MTSLLVLTAMTVLCRGTVDLTWTPAKGETSTWSVSIKGDISGKSVHAESNVQHTVTRAGNDGFTVRSTVLDALARTGADEGRLRRDASNTLSFDAHGTLLKVEGSQRAAVWQLAPFNRFVSPSTPIDIGAGWTSDTKGDGVAGRTEFKLDSVSGGIARVTFVAASVGGDKTTKGTGVWLVDATSGRPVALHAEISGLMDGKAVYEMTLVK